MVQQLGSGHRLLFLLASIPYSFLLGSLDDDELLLATSQPMGGTPAQNVPGCPVNCTCPAEETVDCGGLDLHIFPSNISAGIQHLSLQNNQLQELPYNEVSRLAGLRTLNLHNNHITSEGLPDEAFESLQSLQYIYLANNKLSVAPQLLPSTLRIVDLAANHLTRVYPFTFGHKPGLRSVYMHNNQLNNTGLPFDAFNGSDAVSTLILSSNLLTYVPQNLPRAIVRLHLQPAEEPGVLGSLQQQPDTGACRPPPKHCNPAPGPEPPEPPAPRAPEPRAGAPVPPAAKQRPDSVGGPPRGLCPPSLPAHTTHVQQPAGARPARASAEGPFPHAAAQPDCAHWAAGLCGHLRLGRAQSQLQPSLQRPHPSPGLPQTEAPGDPGHFGQPAHVAAGGAPLQPSGPQPSEKPAQLPFSRAAGQPHDAQGATPGPQPPADRQHIPRHLAGAAWAQDLPESLEYLYLQHNRIAVIMAEAFLTAPNIRVITLRSNRLLAANVSEAAFADLKLLEVVDTTGNPEPITISLLQAGHWVRTQMGT
nr:podocan-like protein 1 isoform X5 [Zootoca vivipara]